MTVPYVHSNFAREENDHYPTIDGRCVEALLDTWPIIDPVVDCCAPDGSGIVDYLQNVGRNAICHPALYNLPACAWLVVNPPYDRAMVDRIAGDMMRVLKAKRIEGLALLMRANWDMAARRKRLFADSLYRGQTRMRFRPWWSEDRKAQPIHNYVWHIWTSGVGEPVVRYWP